MDMWHGYIGAVKERAPLAEAYLFKEHASDTNMASAA